MRRVLHVSGRVLPRVLPQAYACPDLDNKEVERKTKVIKKAKRAKGRPKKDGEEADNNDDDMAKKIPKKPLTAYIIYFQ